MLPDDHPAWVGRAGLCARCTHVRPIDNRRGSRFFFCNLSLTDRAFRRYPTLPVLECRGFELLNPGVDSLQGMSHE